MAFSIIIPSRNLANLRQCVAAIRLAGETARIIVVDDDIEWDQRNPAKMVDVTEIVKGVKPFCFGRNCNLGITAAGEDDVFLLNDDALLVESPYHGKHPLVSQGGLSALAWAYSMQMRPNIGLVSAAIAGYENALQPLNWRSLRLGALPGSDDVLDLATIVKPSMAALPFVCVFIPRTTIKEVGLLDERFYGWVPISEPICENCGTRPAIAMADPHVHYWTCQACATPWSIPTNEVYGGEDDDYCYRVRKAGLGLGFWPGCVVNHATLPSSFRPAGGGRSIAGARMRFYQIHGFSMGSN